MDNNCATTIGCDILHVVSVVIDHSTGIVIQSNLEPSNQPEMVSALIVDPEKLQELV